MISFVYFDLGGVAIKDFSGTHNWDLLKRDLGITPEMNAQFESFFDPYEKEVCEGRDIETLIPLIKEKFHVPLPKNYSLLIDGFVNRFDKNESIWPVIREVCEHCRVGLLTNVYTNMLEAIKARGILPEVSWDVVIDSSIVGLSKPSPKIFELAEQRAGVLGTKIFFVENSVKHVKAAQDFGWQTFLYDSSDLEASSRLLLETFRKNLA
jgi:FMN phosphatase YigB (HAD superfamily)